MGFGKEALMEGNPWLTMPSLQTGVTLCEMSVVRQVIWGTP